MSAPPPTVGAILRRGLAVWALLVALLSLSLLAAHGLLPGGARAALPFGIAAAQGGLVAVLFMRLDRASALVRLTAACGLFWLAILFVLTLADTLSRLANT